MKMMQNGPKSETIGNIGTTKFQFIVHYRFDFMKGFELKIGAFGS